MAFLLSGRNLYNRWVKLSGRHPLFKKWLMHAFLMRAECASILHLEIKHYLHEGGNGM